MFALQAMLFFSLYVTSPVAFQVTVCDCSEPLQTGIIQFSDEDCHPEQKQADVHPVEYSVYTEIRGETKFPGFLCARWKQQKHITMSFFGQRVIVPDKIALETSPMECWTMYESRRCNDNPMTISENKFVFDQEPAEDGWWLSTIVSETVNCVVEKVQLYQEDEGHSFPTPLGTASASAGSLSHNHITLVWDKSFTQQSKPKAHLLESGAGTLMPFGSSNKLRLHDVSKELEFHLVRNKRCLPPLVDCSSKVDAYDVIGQPKLFLIITTKVNHSATNATFKSPQLFKTAGNIDILANIQYIKDQLIDHANDLVRVIDTLQCQSRKAVHDRVISTAQFNGWLAASMVQLPQCTKLSAYGKTALAISCKKMSVDFSVQVTACGPQPRYKDFTINRDGWELVPFSPCYWTTGFVNFNDRPYGYRNGTWFPIEAKIVIPQQTLAHSFRYEEVRYFDYVHQTNPAYNDMVLDGMNVLADIVASINDHSSGNFTSSHLPRTNNVLLAAQDISVYPEWIQSFKFYFLIVVAIIVVLIFLRLCIACGFFSLLKELCCVYRVPSRNAGYRSRALPDSEMELRGVIQRGRE